MLGMLGGRGNPFDGRSPLSNATWLATESTGALPLEEIVAHSVTAAPDIDAVATRNGDEIDVLVWNYHDADVPAEPATVSITVDGLSGAWVVNKFLMDATHGNAYTAWQQMRSPAHPTEDQINRLQKLGRLAKSMPSPNVAAKDGKIGFTETLPRQGVMLIRLHLR
jgi:xylan 1,4-beta-xylosidase